ncbi:MAG: tetratricopeptide repeat-containing glycosyltransferase family protein [Desulfobacula sp.]|nr:tetratricopeptide repeat-containing glycosyltransferase family protein [Desulfobacula sp.]
MIDIEQILKKGVEFHTAGNYREAEMAYRQVLSIDPENPDAIHFMGVLAFHVNQNKIAKEFLTKAIKLTPDNAACYLNMGNVLQQEEDYEGAVKWYERSKALNPNNKKVYSNLGVAFSKIGKLEASVASLKKSIKLDPCYADAHNNLSETYKFLGEYDKALDSSNKAISLVSNFVAARWNRSILLLLKGDLENGLAEYEWRWQRPQTKSRSFDSGEKWQGQQLTGKTIFVYEEQGMGDTIQFMRYLPLLQSMGGKVILEVVAPLVRLVESFKGFDRLWVGIKNVDTRPTDRFDFHVPLLALPGIFKTTLENIPDKIPYLRPDSHLVQVWKKRIKKLDSFKIGIVWAGHQNHANDMNRSVLLSKFKSLKKLEKISLYSLQKEKYGRWTNINPVQIFDQDLGEEISDFADTAAIIENLDLVISIDTSVVHLAGALGKEVLTLLPFSPDWRWMIDRDDSPWYPTMKLFRQPAPGDWNTVFKNVKKYLEKRLKQEI